MASRVELAFDHGPEDRALRLVPVPAIAKATSSRKSDLEAREVGGQIGGREVGGDEVSKSGGIDELASARQGVQGRPRRHVAPQAREAIDLPDLEIETGYEGIRERALPDPGRPNERPPHPGEVGSKGIEPDTGVRAHRQHRNARVVRSEQHSHLLEQPEGVREIALVDDEKRLDASSSGGDDRTIDVAPRRRRTSGDRDPEDVEIRSDRPRPIPGISSRENRPSRLELGALGGDLHAIPYDHRIAVPANANPPVLSPFQYDLDLEPEVTDDDGVVLHGGHGISSAGRAP